MEERPNTAETVEKKQDAFISEQPENSFCSGYFSIKTVKKIEKKVFLAIPEITM